MSERWGPRHGRSNNTAHTATMHSSWLVSRFCLALVSMGEQYPIDCAVLYSCCCSCTFPIIELHASLSILYCPVVRGIASIGEFVSSVLWISTAFLSVLVRRALWAGPFVTSCSTMLPLLRNSEQNDKIWSKNPKIISIPSDSSVVRGRAHLRLSPQIVPFFLFYGMTEVSSPLHDKQTPFWFDCDLSTSKQCQYYSYVQYVVVEIFWKEHGIVMLRQGRLPF